MTFMELTVVFSSARKRIIRVAAVCGCVAGLGACSTTDTLYTVGGAAAGAGAGGLIGQKSSRNPIAPFIGAASGAVIGGLGTAFMLHSAEQGRKKEFQRGYDLGASDTVKRQYWVLQDLQKKGEQTRPPYRLNYYEFPVKPDPKAPVKTAPYDITIPIYE